MVSKMSFPGRNLQQGKKTLDADLLDLVREYLARNSQKSYINIEDMVETLQGKSFRFARMKKQAFTAMVKRAYYRYYEIQQGSQGQSNGSSSNQASVNPTSSFPIDSELLDKVSSDSDIEIVEPGAQAKKEMSPKNKPQEPVSVNDARQLKPRELNYTSIPNRPELEIRPQALIPEKNLSPSEARLVGRPRGLKRKYEEDGELDKSASPRPKENKSKKLKREIPLAEVGGYSFDDFAGGEKIIEEICQLLLHLKHPEIYKTLGVTPPRGFLLHGPPGCGKSLLANAIAGELKMPMLKMAATELISGISGESEGNIRDLFRQALDLAPSIIFLDEIDSITPKRETAQREMERRIVAQMLACIDELGQKEKGDAVLLIGATNRLETIDSALRRAGRFDREISIGIPDEKTREKILRVICKNLRLQPNFNFELLAKLTPGYVGADLQALAREAAIHAINAVLNPEASDSTIDVRAEVKSPPLDSVAAAEVGTTIGDIVATEESKINDTLVTVENDASDNKLVEEKSSVKNEVSAGSDNSGEKMEIESTETIEPPTKLTPESISQEKAKPESIKETVNDVPSEADKPKPTTSTTNEVVVDSEKEKEIKEVILDSEAENIKHLPAKIEPVESTSLSIAGPNGNEMEVITIDNDADEKDEVADEPILETSEKMDAEEADKTVPPAANVSPVANIPPVVNAPSVVSAPPVVNAPSVVSAPPVVNAPPMVNVPLVVNIDEESDDLYDNIESLEDNPDCVIRNANAEPEERTENDLDDIRVDAIVDVDKKPSSKWIHDVSPLKQEQLNKIFIELKHFQVALKYVQPSSKREGFATVPDTTWDDIGALREIRDELQVSILGPVKYSKAFNALGINNPAGVLLCGPPGCGKTLLAKAVANEAGINFISVKGPELLNMYVGESERAVRQCFLRAKNSAPCVIFFDELDALCPRRSDGDANSTSRVVNQLLTEMDGMESRTGVYIMAATNRPDIIDPAVLRPGRLDKILFVNLPTTSDRVDILQTITKQGTKPRLTDDVVLAEIAENEKCSGYTGADLAALVREASVEAFRELVLLPHLANTKVASDSDLKVSKRHFMAAFSKIKPSVSKKDLDKYAVMKDKYSQLTTQ